MLDTVILSVIVVLLTVSLVLDLLFRREVKGIYDDIRRFVEPTGDGEPSPLAGLTDSVLDLAAGKLTARVKTTFMGMQSGAARAEKAVDGAIAIDSVGVENPAMGALLSAFPHLQKVIRRNPALAGFAMDKLGQMAAGRNGGKPGGSQGVSEPYQSNLGL